MNHRLSRLFITLDAGHDLLFARFLTSTTIISFIDMVKSFVKENVTAVWSRIPRLLGDVSQYLSKWTPPHHLVLFQGSIRANQNRRRLIEGPFQDELSACLVLAETILKYARMTVSRDADGD